MDLSKTNPNRIQSERAKNFLRRNPSVKHNKQLERPTDFMIEEYSEDILAHWQGPEYEVYPKDKKWYLIATLILAAIIAYAIITNSPIMAITFILIGIVGYIHLQKSPRVLDFKISRDGVSAGNEIYEFDQIKSFWIFYEPPHTRILSLHTRGSLVPYVHIPIHQEDPSKIRKALLKSIPEKKQSFTVIDTLERLLHI